MNKEGKEAPRKRGEKEMNIEDGKEEPWKRGKKGMNNKEGKEGSWKRGKRGMKNKDGKEEPWKRGKVKPGKREGEMTNKVEKEKHSENLKSERSKLLRFFSRVFAFPLYRPPLRPFFRFGRPSLP